MTVIKKKLAPIMNTGSIDLDPPIIGAMAPTPLKVGATVEVSFANIGICRVESHDPQTDEVRVKTLRKVTGLLTADGYPVGGQITATVRLCHCKEIDITGRCQDCGDHLNDYGQCLYCD